LTRADNQAALSSGATATALDEADGYVHLSTRDTAAETARLHYAGQADVQLLEFAIADLPPLKWEPSRGGTLFPHLYARLEVKYACRQWTLQQDASGAPVLPEDF
jgi:uncharacterized protein (DUF952 family)